MSIETITQMIIDNGVWLILLLVALENLGIPGYPGGFTLPALGAVSQMGFVSLPAGFGIAVVAGSITQMAVYLVGLFFGDWATLKLAKGEKFAKGNQYLRGLIQKYGNPAVFFARLIPFVRVFVSITAGLLGMEWRRYILYSFLGNLVYTASAMAVGYFAVAIIM